MLVGVDLDGIFYNMDQFDKEIFYPMLGSKYIFDPTKYNTSERFPNLPEEKDCETFSRLSDVYLKDYRTFNGVIVDPNLVCAVTARYEDPKYWGFDNIEERTIKDMKEYNIHKVHFYIDKVQGYKDLGLTSMIEDCPENFLALREAGCNVFLCDAEYNRHIETNKRVKNVIEYFDILGVKYTLF